MSRSATVTPARVVVADEWLPPDRCEDIRCDALLRIGTAHLALCLHHPERALPDLPADRSGLDAQRLGIVAVDLAALWAARPPRASARDGLRTLLLDQVVGKRWLHRCTIHERTRSVDGCGHRFRHKRSSHRVVRPSIRTPRDHHRRWDGRPLLPRPLVPTMPRRRATRSRGSGSACRSIGASSAYRATGSGRHTTTRIRSVPRARNASTYPPASRGRHRQRHRRTSAPHRLAGIIRHPGAGASAPFAMLLPSSPRRRMKIGRNEPCPCGSGRKYKHCCLAKDGVRAQGDLPWRRMRRLLQEYPGQMLGFIAKAYGPVMEEAWEEFVPVARRTQSAG